MFRLFTLLFIFAIPGASSAQVEFTSSNLPIVMIETGGVDIPGEDKIPGRMAIIDNGPGQRNHVSDTPRGYSGHIGIEVRGSSSTIYPKKQYSVETRDATGENLNVSLLGMPEENDWILNAPYSDKTLMRNALTHHMGRATGRYASRTRWVEVVLNREYMGVYVLLEKIKRDKDRVDISTLRPEEISGDDLTGGYIVQIDRPNAPGWFSDYTPETQTARIYYQYAYPKPADIAPEQSAYIRGIISEFEDVMASESFSDPVQGYPSVIDVASFVDYIAVIEAVGDRDAYRLSTYLHKDKDSDEPLLQAGPLWDFNFALGNNTADTDNYQFDLDYSYTTHELPRWWPRLGHDPAFRAKWADRWFELREGPFHTDSLLAYIDDTAALLGESQARNFEKWPTLGTRVYPNDFVIGETYEEEVAYLKDWLVARLAWLDEDLRGAIVSAEPQTEACASGAPATYPNPVRTRLTVEVCPVTPEAITVEVFDVRGRRVALAETAVAGRITSRIDVPLSGVASGAYVLRVRGERTALSHVITVVAPR